MRFETNKLSGAALDIAVAIALGYTVEGTVEQYGYIRWRTPEGEILCFAFTPGSDPSRAQIIITEARIAVIPTFRETTWMAEMWVGPVNHSVHHCPDPITAAMRCFVASRLGYEIDLPDELLLAA